MNDAELWSYQRSGMLTGKEERKVKITCIALDLDGTTLTPQGRLSRKTREAIEKALEAGIQVVAASGRSLDSLPEDILGNIRDPIWDHFQWSCGIQAFRQKMPETV